MDLILYNGNIITMEKSQPKVEAVAIKENKIFKVGNNDEILNLKESNTKLIDLNNKTTVPGFNDSHMHILNYAKHLDEYINLKDCRSINDIKTKISNFINSKKINDTLIIARDWNDNSLSENRIPKKTELDSISKKIPIMIIRHCGNIAVLNTKAIKKFNSFLKKTKKNSPESIVTDQNGKITGLLKGTYVINSIIPPLSKNKIKNKLNKALKNCLKYGITSIQTDDFSTAKIKDVLNVYFDMNKNKELPIRINEQLRLPTIEKLQNFIDMGYTTGDGNEFFKIGPLKLVADGTLGGRTAALRKTYHDDPNNKGITIYNQEELNNLVLLAHKNNLQVAIHAIGDKTLEMALNSFNNAVKKYPKSDPRFRIIHGQINGKNLLNKMKKLNVIVDVQPLFISSDLSIVKSRLGKERMKWSYNWKTLLNNNINLGAGSDCPVEPFDPLLGIYAFVTRKTLEGYPKEGWLPNEKLTPEQALYSYTMGSAYCSYEEKIKGSIKPNKLADVVVLSDNIFNIEPDKIKNVKVEKTIINGKIKYEL